VKKLFSVFTGLMIAFLLFVPVPQKAHAQPTPEDFWLIAVGISEYKYYENAKYNDKAATEVANYFKSVWGESHIKLLTNSDATKSNIKNAICDWLAPKEHSNDTVLIFFACHSKEGFISPTDSLSGSLVNDITPVELDGWLNTLESQKLAVMIETCFSGSLVGKLSKRGRVVLTSSAASELSGGDSLLSQFFFPFYFLQGLKDFVKLDQNKDNRISAEEIYQYVSPKVTSYAQLMHRKNQSPQIYDGYTGELFLLSFARITLAISQKVPDLSATIDGKKYAASQLPQTFIWLGGASHTVEMSGKEIYPTGAKDKNTRYFFTSWSDGNLDPKRTIKVSEAKDFKITADYKTQHRLALKSERGNPTGEGWYNEGSTVTISVDPSEGILIRKVFAGWSGDLAGGNPKENIVMSKPKTITANWRDDYIQLYALIAVILLSVGGIIFILRRRKRILS